MAFRLWWPILVQRLGTTMGKTITAIALSSAMVVAGAAGAFAATLDFTALSTFTTGGATATSSGASGTFQGVIWTLTPSSPKKISYNFGAPATGALLGDLSKNQNQGFDGVAKPVGTGLALEGDGVGVGRRRDHARSRSVRDTLPSGRQSRSAPSTSWICSMAPHAAKEPRLLRSGIRQRTPCLPLSLPIRKLQPMQSAATSSVHLMEPSR